MTNIIVAFSKQENAKNVKNILMRNGFEVVAICTSGAQVLNSLEGLNGGIVVSGYRFEDMLYQDVRDDMPKGVEMLLVASPNRFGGMMPQDIVCLPMPLKVHELVDTVHMLVRRCEQNRRKRRERPRERTPEEMELIARAKALLMEERSMTEMQAHKYLQKCSMDSGRSIVESAQMILMM